MTLLPIRSGLRFRSTTISGMVFAKFGTNLVSVVNVCIRSGCVSTNATIGSRAALFRRFFVMSIFGLLTAHGASGSSTPTTAWGDGKFQIDATRPHSTMILICNGPRGHRSISSVTLTEEDTDISFTQVCSRNRARAFRGRTFTVLTVVNRSELAVDLTYFVIDNGLRRSGT
jgi:hypothetical protein